ncbi:hypothetical protein FPQ18DRAFT_384435 [Pyronema domesticum]|uniref:Uncharacterized protein n=1 Tax=Pyronema omphalodes (strain CBS 100304) TaxID=1076935 RepID=U4L5B6_PYROM|nr:hypothetical protein FPQ18DRAFT_384435 [Pyronema domesticum]CCX05240.1 Protein of unknown function [Pyronema omphalodes CBS 100304]
MKNDHKDNNKNKKAEALKLPVRETANQPAPKPDSPGPSPPPPPPSPAEEAILGSSSRPANAATTKPGSVNKKDLSGMSRYEKQRFWGWLCDEDGRVDVTHPAFTGFRPH